MKANKLWYDMRMYTIKKTVTSNDVDQNLELRLASLFKFLQEVASEQCDKLGVGHWDLFKHNMLWVVIRMDIHIYRTPKLDEELIVGTHAGPQRSFLYPRFFEVKDSKKNVIIRGSSLWTLIDENTRKVVVKPPECARVDGKDEKGDLPLPDKVLEGEATELVDTRKVKYSEIDLNGHLNNTNYVSFITDTHEPEFFKNNRVNRITVFYDKEIRANAEVKLYSNKQNPETIRGEVEGNTHFTARIEYEKR